MGWVMDERICQYNVVELLAPHSLRSDSMNVVINDSKVGTYRKSEWTTQFLNTYPRMHVYSHVPASKQIWNPKKATRYHQWLHILRQVYTKHPMQIPSHLQPHANHSSLLPAFSSTGTKQQIASVKLKLPTGFPSSLTSQTLCTSFSIHFSIASLIVDPREETIGSGWVASRERNSETGLKSVGIVSRERVRRSLAERFPTRIPVSGSVMATLDMWWIVMDLKTTRVLRLEGMWRAYLGLREVQRWSG